MEQGLVISPVGGSSLSGRQAGAVVQPGREGVWVVLGYSWGTRLGILGAEVSCDWRVDRLIWMDLAFLPVMP